MRHAVVSSKWNEWAKRNFNFLCVCVCSFVLLIANSSPKMFASSAPLRLDNLSLAEQHELKGAAWFQAGIPREISLEVLSRQSPGAFLVRQSSTKPGCFALSLRVPPPAPKVAHYLILRTPRGYKIKVSYMKNKETRYTCWLGFEMMWNEVEVMAYVVIFSLTSFAGLHQGVLLVARAHHASLGNAWTPACATDVTTSNTHRRSRTG